MKKMSIMKRKKFVIYAKKNTYKTDENGFKLYHQVRDHGHYTEDHFTPFHNVSTHDYHVIINQLAKEFDGQLELLGENTEKYITFSVLIKKELDNSKRITYKLKFTDSFRLCQPHYQNLLNIYQGNFIVISAQIVNLNLIICLLKMIN